MWPFKKSKPSEPTQYEYDVGRNEIRCLMYSGDVKTFELVGKVHPYHGETSADELLRAWLDDESTFVMLTPGDFVNKSWIKTVEAVGFSHKVMSTYHPDRGGKAW